MSSTAWFALIALVVLGGAFALFRPDLLLARKSPPPLPPEEPKAPVIAAEPEHQVAIGNVEVIPAEWKAAPPTGDLFAFSDRPAPVTRFEDLNRRLWAYTSESNHLLKGLAAPRDLNDFVGLIGSTPRKLDEILERQFRPGYGVIVDHGGYFLNASAALEVNPSYRNILIDTYLSIPETRRPIVISFREPEKGEVRFTFLRYAFKPFVLKLSQLSPYPEDSTRYILDRFVGDRNEWCWFSIARLRHDVAALNKPREDARKAHDAAKAAAEQKIRDMLDPRNRFSQLWQQRHDRKPDNGEKSAVPAAQDSSEGAGA